MRQVRTFFITAASCFIFAAAVSAQATTTTLPKPAADLTGTEWVATPDIDNTVITWRFEKGGFLAYRSKGKYYRNGKWKQDGNQLYFETNEKYREFKGYVSGDVITGSSWNLTGAEWVTTAYKYNKP